MALSTVVKRWGARLGFKQADDFIPARGVIWYGSSAVPRTDYPYAGAVGDGLGSSVITPVVQFIARAFPEAPLVVRQRTQDTLEIAEGHPLAALIERPNPFYPGTLLWMATLIDWCWWGESYWRILHEMGGRPAELWWLPPWSIEPKWPQDGSVYISHYEYSPDGKAKERIPVEDIVHFRHGMDPRNTRHGLPPLRAIVRDIFSDDEAANWVASLLRNMAIPGMIVSPKGEDSTINPDDVEVIKTYVHSRFVGDHRGEPLVIGKPTLVDRLAWSPQEMDMHDVRKVAEARVCAALGIPASVVGFNAGMDTTRVGATMHESVKLAWNNGIIPVQRLMAAELQRALLPQFEPDTSRWLVGWNYDEVGALEVDQNALAKRAVELYQGGVLMRSEARQLMGYEAQDGDEIYLVPSAMTEEGPDAPEEPEPAPVPAIPAANGHGNGLPTAQARSLSGVSAKQSLDEWLTESIGRRAPRLEKPPAALLRVATRIMRDEKRLQPTFQRMLRQVLTRYGDRAVTATRELFPQKASAEDIVRTAIVRERIPFASVTFELAQVYADIGGLIVDMLVKALRDGLHLELSSDARLKALVQQAAQERVVLLDLSTDARDALLRSLTEMTEQGLSQDAMVELVRQRVPAGRWSTPEIRAEIIARTESRFALNQASARFSEESGVGRCLILDALLGPTDATCEFLAGAVVTPSEARALAASEHVNGTRLVVPITPAMITQAS